MRPNHIPLLDEKAELTCEGYELYEKLMGAIRPMLACHFRKDASARDNFDVATMAMRDAIRERYEGCSREDE